MFLCARWMGFLRVTCSLEDLSFVISPGGTTSFEVEAGAVIFTAVFKPSHETGGKELWAIGAEEVVRNGATTGYGCTLGEFSLVVAIDEGAS